MHRSRVVSQMTAAALLIALGIVIPMFSPVKIVLPPASFTLASHVPVFLAMFISPAVAAATAVGTTLGFFLGGFPLVIVLRAATHLLFALLGAAFLAARPSIVFNMLKAQLFSLAVAAIHGASEVIAVTPLFLQGDMSTGYYENGFFLSVVVLVGIGTVVHSMLDFSIALGLLRAVSKQPFFRQVFGGAQTSGQAASAGRRGQ